MQLVQSLPYHQDSGVLFDTIADEPWACFLDSGVLCSHGCGLGARAGRYDILTSRPYLTLTGRNGVTEIRSGEHLSHSTGDPFDLLRLHLGTPTAPIPGIPFPGGAIGWFGYDLARRLHRLPRIALDDLDLPDFALAFYDWALVVDHGERRSHLVSGGRDPGTRTIWKGLIERFSSPAEPPERAPLRRLSPMVTNLDATAYTGAFARVRSYIRAGDCYQVNLARRFEAQCEGHPWAGFRQLRRNAAAPFAAYLNTPEMQILCASPERFLQLREGVVETRPIKGTRPRSEDPLEDRRLAQELAESPKDRAENLMIVDLLRNDLGRVCRPGTIEVPELFRVESFPQVHHLVSTIRGTLAPGEDAASLLRAAFPGGSITGAPKLRAMQIIEELEPHRRGPYCGVIGYLGYDGGMDSNIVIRTLLHQRGRVLFHAGGGIVADSEAEQEFAETRHKAAALFRLLESEPR